jgi:hypothetical protein
MLATDHVLPDAAIGIASDAKGSRPDVKRQA